MPTLWDCAIEKCAGRGPSDKLRQRLFEKRYLASVIAPDSTPAVESPKRSKNLPTEESRLLPAPFPTEDSAHSRADSLPPRGRSLIVEKARQPRYHGEQRWRVSFEDIKSAQDLAPDPALNREKSTSRPPSLWNWSDEEGEENPTGRKSFLYPVPRLPEMIGHGRFRHSKTATAEWAKENLRRGFDATSLDLTEGFEVLEHNRQPFIIRKGSGASSAASCVPSQMECDVDPMTGSATTRGFVSPPSNFTPGSLGLPEGEQTKERSQNQASLPSSFTPGNLRFSKEGKIEQRSQQQVEVSHPHVHSSQQGSNTSGTDQVIEVRPTVAATENPINVPDKPTINLPCSNLPNTPQKPAQQTPTSHHKTKQSLICQEDVIRALRSSNDIKVEEAIIEDEDPKKNNEDNGEVTANHHPQIQRKTFNAHHNPVKPRKRAPTQKGRRGSSGVRKQQLQRLVQTIQNSTLGDQPTKVFGDQPAIEKTLDKPRIGC